MRFPARDATPAAGIGGAKHVRGQRPTRVGEKRPPGAGRALAVALGHGPSHGLCLAWQGRWPLPNLGGGIPEYRSAPAPADQRISLRRQPLARRPYRDSARWSRPGACTRDCDTKIGHCVLPARAAMVNRRGCRPFGGPCATVFPPQARVGPQGLDMQQAELSAARPTARPPCLWTKRAFDKWVAPVPPWTEPR